MKAWIDHIVRAGKTFRIVDGNYEGLVKGKKVVIAIAAGGRYDNAFMASYDMESPYLKAVLGFIGITDVTVEFTGKQQ